MDWRDKTGTDLRNSTTHQLNTRGKTDVFTVTPACTSDQLHDGDVLAATAAITGFFLENDGLAKITDIQVTDIDNNGASIDVYLFNAATSLGALHAAGALNDAGMLTLLGYVVVTSSDYIQNFTDVAKSIYLDTSYGGWYIPTWIKAGSSDDDLYLGIVGHGTPTFTASGLQLRISVEYP